MISHPPHVHPKGLYSQKETAYIPKVDRHTIRRLEDAGLLPFYYREGFKRRVTWGRDIIKCWYSVTNGKL